ncbi:hypothetical protein N5912_07535 [Arcobacter lacus]|uniref:hypothetical protein n=1 Tax=Arcobacter lacus TaxID=1912876 RepID=UPI0021BAAD87|nr:hypothetical protein [Arcobacter lacus]MCT7911677.1 hypothetical protein [Arcobacter lacus]
MHSWKNFFIFGIQRAIISYTTFGFIALIFFKVLTTFTVISYILFLITASYVNFFDWLKFHNSPTPRLYNTGYVHTFRTLFAIPVFIGIFHNIFKIIS